MTTPRDDIAGLSERLRKRSEPSEYSTGDVLGEEAATQLDSLLKERDALQARVKELEVEVAEEEQRGDEATRRATDLARRALRAEQERDEAVAVLNPFMPDPTMMDLLWGDMDDEATGSHTIKLKHFRAARDLVRRLAGPEKA